VLSFAGMAKLADLPAAGRRTILLSAAPRGQAKSRFSGKGYPKEETRSSFN